MKTAANHKTAITALLVFFISFVSYSQISTGSGNAGYVCPREGHYERTAQGMKTHTCTQHGFNCPTTPTYIPPAPAKTQQQIWEEAEKKRKDAEKKDMQEAAETVNEEGMEYYEKKDWATAINYFKVALGYVPDFEDAIYNLKKANEKLEAERLRVEEERQRKEKEELEKSLEIMKKQLEAERTISVKNTSTEAISNQINTEKSIPGKMETMKDQSGKAFDTKGDDKGSLADVKIKVVITPAQEKAAREYLAKNDKEYQARQIKLKETREQVSKFRKKDDELSKTIDDYKKNYTGKNSPKEEFDKYTKAIQEQQTIKGQLWNVQSTEKTLQQKDQEAIKKYVTFGEKKIPGQ